MIYKPHCHYQNFSPLANGVYIILIINKTPLRNGNWPITDPITEMGVAHTVGQWQQVWFGWQIRLGNFFNTFLLKNFFQEDFLKEDFFQEDFFQEDFFQEDFFQEDFFQEDFFREDFFRKDFFWEDFFQGDIFQEDFFWGYFLSRRFSIMERRLLPRRFL